MSGWLAGLLLALAPAPASAAPPNVTPEPPPSTVSAEVVRDRDAWTVEFTFAEPSPVWLFAHSSVTREGHRPWRPGSWTVLTPGVPTWNGSLEARMSAIRSARLR